MSASNLFVFSIQDEHGESYNLEIPAGWRGFPIAEFAYFALEAGTDGQRTNMRASLNGRIVAERTIPFPISFPDDPGQIAIGSNREGTEAAAFLINLLITRDNTLDHQEAAGVAKLMTQRLPA